MWSTMRITSVIAENKPDAYHEPHLQVMKVVTILIPSFHGRRQECLGAQPPFCVLNTKKKSSLQIMTLGARQPQVIK